MTPQKLRRLILERMAERRQFALDTLIGGVPDKVYWEFVGRIRQIDEFVQDVTDIVEDFEESNRRLFDEN